jgi:chitin disaccharide deacetylase
MIIADDYGDNIADDKVIIDLLNKKNIGGTSILIKNIDNVSINLITNRKDGLIGLHLDLDINPLESIILSKDAKKLIEQDIIKQVDKFKFHFNKYPDFIDGHRHVHSYFNIQEILIKVLLNINFNGFVRVSAEDMSIRNLKSLYKRGSLLKGVFISLLSKILAKKLKKNQIRHNKKFLGFYDLANTINTKNSFSEIMSLYDGDCLCMVHPGAISSFEDDHRHSSINRKFEADFLMKHSK